MSGNGKSFRTKSLVTLFLGAVLVAGAGKALAASWWQLCDSCTDESHFRIAAMNAPGSFTPVYVSNRDTNTTLKFNRWTFTEDFDGELVKSTYVSVAEFPAAEKAVFEEVLESSNRVFTVIDRANLAAPGLRENSGSVVGDLADGWISASLVNALMLNLQVTHALPSHETINERAGLNLYGANYQANTTTVRKRDLLVKIAYEDGSLISVRVQPDGGLVGWVVVDAEGNEIPLESSEGNGPLPVAGGSFADRDFRFGSGNGGAAEELAARVGGMSGGFLECTVSHNGGVTTVSCSKVK